jgi:hypothetical protein
VPSVIILWVTSAGNLKISHKVKKKKNFTLTLVRAVYPELSLNQNLITVIQRFPVYSYYTLNAGLLTCTRAFFLFLDNLLFCMLLFIASIFICFGIVHY